MDVYGPPQPESFLVDDLLDFSNDDIFSSDSDHTFHQQLLPLSDITSTITTSHFNDLVVPSEEVAELEWLSNFVDDSFTDPPASSFADGLETAFHGQSRSKRCRSTSWSSSSTKSKTVTCRVDRSTVDMPRRCTHCASEKTPQWRTGPMGPKTLCNACGVRFKSGRLVPEYRPAASPTFVLTQHSNSHRKVLELRRQKDLLHHHQPPQQQVQVQQHMYGLQHFQVC